MKNLFKGPNAKKTLTLIIVGIIAFLIFGLSISDMGAGHGHDH